MLLQRFLGEVQLPLASMQTLLELADLAAVDPLTALPIRICVEHVEHLLELATDYGDCGAIEAGQVKPTPEPVALLPWLTDTVAGVAATASRLQIDLQIKHRSFLPSHVVLDPVLAARALKSVLRVALQRSLPGRLELRVAFDHDRQAPLRSRLRLECQGRGGGFAEIDQGYVFTPFAVRDAAARPWLGLSVGQALCELLGGGVTVQSPGLSACTYTVAFAAPPAADANWTDPMAGSESSFGPVA